MKTIYISFRSLLMGLSEELQEFFVTENEEWQDITDLVEYSAYFNDVQRRIRRAWFPPDRNKRPMELSVVIVTFIIDRGGNVSKLAAFSDNEALAEQAALKAITNAAPFRPLPEELLLATEELEVEFIFDEYTYRRGEGHSVMAFRIRKEP